MHVPILQGIILTFIAQVAACMKVMTTIKMLGIHVYVYIASLLYIRGYVAILLLRLKLYSKDLWLQK